MGLPNASTRGSTGIDASGLEPMIGAERAIREHKASRKRRGGFLGQLSWPRRVAT
jgi:hypothetical protein